MAEGQGGRIFISYARADGEGTAARLEALLRENGRSVWRDIHDMPPGDVILSALHKAIKDVDHLALILTPGALASEWVTQEWTHARQHGIRVSPILGDDGLTLGDLPRWIRVRDVVSLDDDERVIRLMGVFGQEGKIDRVVYDIGETCDGFVDRPDKVSALKQLLLTAAGEGATVGVTASLRGAGGYGKTVLADHTLRDPEIQCAFYDGVIRLVVGQEVKDVTPTLAETVRRITGKPEGFASVNDAAEALARVIGEKTMLLVIDDVWRGEQLRPFLRGGPNCVRLVTTRNEAVVSDRAHCLDVDEMTGPEALQVLGAGLPRGAEAELRALAETLTPWALRLALANGAIRQLVRYGADPAEAVAEYHQRIRDEGPDDIAASLRASLKDLTDEHRRRFGELGIVPEDTAVPVAVVAALWQQTAGLTPGAAKRLLMDFADRSLLRLSLAKGAEAIRLHDSVLAYLRQHELTAESRRTVEAAMVDGLRARCGGDWRRAAPDEAYLWRFLLDHLTEAGRAAEARALLADFDWLSGALTALGAQTLINLYLPYADDPALDRIHRALAMSIEALSKDPRLLAMHLWGRLGALPEGAERRLAEVARDRQPRDLPRLRHPSFMPPGRERRRLMGHEGRVNTAVFSLDGRRVLTASWDKTARLWDAATGHQLGEPLRHEDAVMSAAFSSDGKGIITASIEGTAYLWDGVTGQLLVKSLRHTGRVLFAAFSPDGRIAATASEDHTARLWDSVTGQPITKSLQHEATVLSAAFSPDGQHVITASADAARLWSVATGQPVGVSLRHEGGVTCVSFSPDGQRVVTASTDNTARLWDVKSGQPLGQPLRHRSGVRCAAFSPDGRCVVTASMDHTACLWDAVTGQPFGELMQHAGPLTGAAFSPGGEFVVTTSSDNTAQIWSAANGQPIGGPLRHEGMVMSAVVSPDKRLILTASDDKTVRLWDAAAEPFLEELLRHQGEVNRVAIAPDGRRVITASFDCTAKLWDSATGQSCGQSIRQERAVKSAIFSPDGRLILTVSYKSADLWDSFTGQPVGKSLRHEDWVTDAAFSPDGRHVITASWDRTAQLWNAETGDPHGRPLQHEGEVYSVAFSPDGQRAVTASGDRTARLWEASTGQPLGHPLWHEACVKSAVFSPDGQHLATASDYPIARVWDVASDKSVVRRLRHQRFVGSAVFSPDGRCVITTSGDNTARLWDTATGHSLGEPLRHEDRLSAIAFSPGGRQVVSVSADKTLRLWDATACARTAIMHLEAKAENLAVVADIIVIGDVLGGVHIFDWPDDPAGSPAP